MNDFKTYRIIRRKGIDDLLREKAFIGNSQGDESASNNIEDYISAKGWMSFVFKGIDKTDQIAILNESKRRMEYNKEYIKKLKEEGRYLEEYSMNIHVKPNPLFDENYG